MPNSIKVNRFHQDVLPRLDRRLIDDTSAKPNFVDAVYEPPGEPTKYPRLDEESFDYHRRTIDQGLASEMIDMYGFESPRAPSHVDRMEYLIETRQTNLMRSYLDFVTSPEFLNSQPSLNGAEVSILQATAAQGVLLDSGVYRLANEEDAQEALHEEARVYLAQAEQSLRGYEDDQGDSTAIEVKASQIRRFIGEISTEIGASSLRDHRLHTEAAQALRRSVAEKRDLDNDLKMAGRPPRPKPVSEQQEPDEHIKLAA